MIFKPLKLAAILECGTQSGLVHLAIERHERVACAAFKQDFHSRQHRVDAPAGALAKLAVPFVEGMPAAAQETPVHPWPNRRGLPATLPGRCGSADVLPTKSAPCHRMCDSQSIPGAVADGSIRWPRARPPAAKP